MAVVVDVVVLGPMIDFVSETQQNTRWRLEQECNKGRSGMEPDSADAIHSIVVKTKASQTSSHYWERNSPTTPYGRDSRNGSYVFYLVVKYIQYLEYLGYRVWRDREVTACIRRVVCSKYHHDTGNWNKIKRREPTQYDIQDHSNTP